MKPLVAAICLFGVLIVPALPGRSAVLLDDIWADGTRTNQNLPTDSAWYASTGAALAAATNAMTLTLGSSAVLGVSYFTANTNVPVSLGVGDTLLATIKFTFSGVAASNSSQGFRIALCDFADSTLLPKRVGADGFSSSSQGAGVQGYAMFQNMGLVLTMAGPMDIRKRAVVTDPALLSSSGDWTSIPGLMTGINFPGFSNGVPYTLLFSLQRTGSNAMLITQTWQNTNGYISMYTTDNAATNFNFDGIAWRPQNAAASATSIVFNEARVEFIPTASPPTISVQPTNQTVYTGQSATFGVTASGSPPLSYQWYFDSSTPLANATNTSFTVANAQLGDAGNYSAMVSNASGAVTSSVATLTVNTPVPPLITTQPQDETVLLGNTASFTVAASGSAPLSYQWYYNSTTPLPNGTGATLMLTNVQLGNAGAYSVVVSNLAGTAISSNAILTVSTNVIAPNLATQPQPAVALVGGTVSFSASATGTAPIGYQWKKNGAAIAGATFTTLTLTNLQTSDAGSYSLTASNGGGVTTSSGASLLVVTNMPVPTSAYNLVGFGRFTTGGGVLPDTDPNYAKVATATDLANAINSKTVKIIEILNDLSLGFNEIEASAKSNSEPFRADNAPSLHPVLLTSGVSIIDIQKKNGLTIFSTNGATIKHAHLNVKNATNIVIRNLKFDELWEWDESSKGDYDDKNWDFITVGDAGAVTNLWIDHCTFTKAYDGLVDIKNGSSGITISWCKYTGDDGATNTNSWVRQQINALEANRSAYAMYNFLRTGGFSPDDIVTIIQGHDKTHLIGANDFDAANALFTVTLHHEWFINPWDRLPRLRGGNVHVFNIYVDDTAGLAAKRLRDTRAPSGTYSFEPFLNGTISTEGGATLVEKSVYIDCLTPLRNNQTAPSNSAYTGKIMALDTIYQMDSTVIRGNSTDPGNPLGPIQAPVIPFSWNLSGNQLPYSYVMDDPGLLRAVVTSPTAGAGSGVLTWAKTNWLITTYLPSPPSILAQPQGQSVGAGQNATFLVLAGGSGPLLYQWYFSTNTPLANATNASLVIANAQAGNAGVYSVVVSNTAGVVASTGAALTVYAQAQPGITSAVLTGGQIRLTVNGPSGANYLVQTSSNLASWQTVFTTNAAVVPFVWTDGSGTIGPARFYRVATSQ